MQYFNTFKRGDGLVTQEWTADEMFNFEFVKYVIFGVLISFLSVIASSICLVVRLFDYDNDEKAPSFVGIVTSLYFLIDYVNGWFVTWLMKILGYGYNLKLFACVNLTMLLVHVFILVLGDTIYFNAEESIRKRSLIIYTGFAIVIAYNVSKCFI
jgi:hypothetical protein